MQPLDLNQLHLYVFNSGHTTVSDLQKFKPRLKARKAGGVEMVKRYLNQRGESRVCGGRDLKSSQAYPLQYHVMTPSFFCLVLIKVLLVVLTLSNQAFKAIC